MERIKLDALGFINYTLEITDNAVIFYGTTGRVLKQSIDSYGYLVVNLESATQSHTQRVHRIVAECCLINSNTNLIVMHKDDNKLNCHPSNLEWGTFKMNNVQCQQRGRNPGNTKKADQIAVIKYEILNGGTYGEIINRCQLKGVKLSTGTLTKYKKELAAECND